MRYRLAPAAIHTFRFLSLAYPQFAGKLPLAVGRGACGRPSSSRHTPRGRECLGSIGFGGKCPLRTGCLFAIALLGLLAVRQRVTRGAPCGSPALSRRTAAASELEADLSPSGHSRKQPEKLNVPFLASVRAQQAPRLAASECPVNEVDFVNPAGCAPGPEEALIDVQLAAIAVSVLLLLAGNLQLATGLPLTYPVSVACSVFLGVWMVWRLAAGALARRPAPVQNAGRITCIGNRADFEAAGGFPNAPVAFEAREFRLWLGRSKSLSHNPCGPQCDVRTGQV